MQARLDSLVPPTCCVSMMPASYGCCPRSTGANDDAPELAGMVADLVERGAHWLLNLAPASLRGAAVARQ